MNISHESKKSKRKTEEVVEKSPVKKQVVQRQQTCIDLCSTRLSQLRLLLNKRPNSRELKDWDTLTRTCLHRFFPLSSQELSLFKSQIRTCYQEAQELYLQSLVEDRAYSSVFPAVDALAFCKGTSEKKIFHKKVVSTPLQLRKKYIAKFDAAFIAYSRWSSIAVEETISGIEIDQSS